MVTWTAGVWTIRLIPRRIVQGNYDMWLPGGQVIGAATRFYEPTPETTLTIPSTAQRVIAVGAYDSRLLSYAGFSGRGYTRVTNQVKPTLVAPGVNIMAPQGEGISQRDRDFLCDAICHRGRAPC